MTFDLWSVITGFLSVYCISLIGFAIILFFAVGGDE